ncbi:cadherin domain-containing protein [Ekhidna sp.]|uniref:cadherin domain-containing protein n=1 Tax=Ekhidna sp. TaxID=2608089 RepID=UPI003B512CBA
MKLFQIIFKSSLIVSLLAVLILGSFKKSTDLEERKLTRVERNKLRSEYFFNKLKDPKTNTLPANIRHQELLFSNNLKATYDAKNELGVNAGPSYDWNEVGPADVGGRTRAIAQDFRNGDIVLAGGISGGIWKSTDGGSTWESKLPEGSNLSISSIAQDTISGDVWYATSGELGDGGSTRGKFFSNFYLGLGIYKSVDNGETWELMTYSSNGTNSLIKDSTPDINIPNGLSHPFIITGKVLVANFSGPVIIITTQYSGIWFSDDGGDSFSLFGSQLASGEIPTYSDIIVDNNGVITVWLGPTDSGNNGFYRSYDGGSSFFTVNPNTYPTLSDGARTVLAFSLNSPDNIYAFTYDGGGTDYLFAFDFANLTANGGTFEGIDRSQNLPDFDRSIFGGSEEFSTQGGYDMTLAVHPNDPDFVVLGYVNLIKSEDGFATALTSNPAKSWIGGNENPYRLDEDLPFNNTHHADQHIVFFDNDNPNIVWSGHDGGISKTMDITADRVIWESLNNDYNVTQFYTVATSTYNGDSYVLGGTQDNGTPIMDHSSFSSSLLPSQQDISSGDGAYCYATGPIIYSSVQNGVLVLYDIDNDFNSRSVGFIKRDDLSRFFIHPFTVDPNDEGTIFYATNGDGVIARNDQFDEAYSAGSLNLDLINNGWDDFALDGAYQITALKVTNENPSHTLYFGGLFGDTPVLASWSNANTDDGTGITGRDLNEVPAGAWLNDIAVNPLDGEEIILVYSNFNIDGLFYSSDGGATLTSIEGNLGDNDSGNGITGPSLRAAEIIQAADGSKKYVVGTSIGLFSTDQLNGANTNWTLETPLLDNIVIEDLDLRAEDGVLAVGTHGRGLFMGTPDSNNSSPLISDQAFDVDENSAVGTPVGTIEASDPDNDNLSFAIASGNDSQQFALDGATGILTVADPEAFDFEASSSYELAIKVSDGNGGSAQASISVMINDVNEAPEFLVIDFDIDENVANGTTVGSIEATDPENDNVSFELSEANDVFDVSSDGTITVADNTALDYEVNTFFEFEVIASDGSLTSSETIVIEVNDLNDGVLSAQEFTFYTYPNPTQDYIHLEGFDGELEYKLTDLSGQTLDTGLINSSGSTIDLSAHRPGMYLLIINTEDRKETLRITRR